MDIWDANKLLLFIGFVIPGFVTLKTYELLLPAASKESAQQLIDAVAYSCINYALLLWPIAAVETTQFYSAHPRLYVAFYVFALLVAPVLWAVAFKLFRTTTIAQKILPHPLGKPWDYVFGQRKPYWIILTLKDGKQIAGRYDDSSFASSAPAPEQIYLEEAWVQNAEGGFERPRADTAGIMVLGLDVVTVEFFHITYGDGNDRQEAIG